MVLPTSLVLPIGDMTSASSDSISGTPSFLAILELDLLLCLPVHIGTGLSFADLPFQTPT